MMLRHPPGISTLVALLAVVTVCVGCRTERPRPASELTKDGAAVRGTLLPDSAIRTSAALSVQLRALTVAYAEVDTSIVAGADARFYREIDSIARVLSSFAQTEHDPTRVIDAMNRCVFGHWNITFTDDRNNVRFLLPHLVLKEKKGSCVGMSLLFLLLAERAGLPLYAVRAPSHLFVRYDSGRERLNIETLRGGETMSDAWYRKRFSITDSMRYPLRNLTGTEAAAVVAYNLGTICLGDKHHDHAVRFLQKAIDGMPDFPEAKGNLALAFVANGEIRRALNVLIELRGACPSLERIDRNIGSLQLQCGKYSDALASFDSACVMYSDDADAHYGRAVALSRLSRSDEAATALDRVLALRPDYPAAEALRIKLRR